MRFYEVETDTLVVINQDLGNGKVDYSVIHNGELTNYIDYYDYLQDELIKYGFVED